MGNQTSETHDRFRNEPQIPADVKEFVPNPQGFNLSNHHTDGPSKVMKTVYIIPKYEGKNVPIQFTRTDKIYSSAVIHTISSKDSSLTEQKTLAPHIKHA